MKKKTYTQPAAAVIPVCAEAAVLTTSPQVENEQYGDLDTDLWG